MEDFYRAVIGPKNQDYYLARFQQFDQAGKAATSWHWPAFFVTFYWFLYRKMWINALIYFFLPYIALIPMAIIATVVGDSIEALSGMYIAYLLAIFIIPGVYGNALYYRHCKSQIQDVSRSSKDPQRQLGELSGKGGTSNIVLIVILLLVFVSVVGILAAIAIPAYQDYTTRARTTQAMLLGQEAADAVGRYYQQTQRIPARLQEAGFSTPLPAHIREIGVDPLNGVVHITMASGPITGKSLLLIPSVDEAAQVSWKCMSEDIQDKYLPPRCRH